MKLLLLPLATLALIFGMTGSAAASEADETIRLARNLVRAVEDHAHNMDPHNLRQLNRELEDLIARVRQGNGGSGSYRLICKYSGYQAAIYNLATERFIDSHYSQTIADCNRIVNATRENLTCGSDSTGRTALYNLKLEKFIDTHYAKHVDDCIKTLQSSRRGLTCSTDSSGTRAAIYDVINDKFVDSYYDKTLDECLSSI
jgi:hypothetical protein